MVDIDKIINEELHDTACKTREALARRIARRVRVETLKKAIEVIDRTEGGYQRAALAKVELERLITTTEQEATR